MREYSSLQLILDERVEAARERIIYAVTAYMDGCGFVPCGGDSAERTVAFARVDGGWAVFDDCADRLDIRALNGLARCLTSSLHTRAVGVMGMKNGFVLRLYSDGIIRDTFCTSSKLLVSPTGRMRFPGHAIRWRLSLGGGGNILELSSAFLRARKQPEEGFEELCRLLSLHKSASYGFASIEDAGLEGVVTLYFHAANHIRQRWIDRFLRAPAKCPGAVSSAFSQKKGCRLH